MPTLESALRRCKAAVRALCHDEHAPQTLYVAQAFTQFPYEGTFLGIFESREIAQACAKKAIASIGDLAGADVLVLETQVIEQPWAYDPRRYVD